MVRFEAGRWQTTEDRRRMTEGRRQMTDGEYRTPIDTFRTGKEYRIMKLRLLRSFDLAQDKSARNDPAANYPALIRR